MHDRMANSVNPDQTALSKNLGTCDRETLLNFKRTVPIISKRQMQAHCLFMIIKWTSLRKKKFHCIPTMYCFMLNLSTTKKSVLLSRFAAEHSFWVLGWQKFAITFYCVKLILEMNHTAIIGFLTICRALYSIRGRIALALWPWINYFARNVKINHSDNFTLSPPNHVLVFQPAL